MSEVIYDFGLQDLEGKTVNLAGYKGKVLMIVNIASKCGLTPQLGSLERLYQKYRDRGFEILAFPSDDFNQEPKEGEAIQQFCGEKYGVSYTILNKGSVRGGEAQPLYKYLANNSKIGFIKNFPLWNFQKYIISRNGKVVDYFAPWTRPESAKITGVIEKWLAEKPVEK